MSEDDQLTVGEADSEPFGLPVQSVLTGRTAVLGKSGSGKSNSASVIIEQLLERGYSCLIVDVDGEYFGLKEEFEVLVLGDSPEAEGRVGPAHAEWVASRALEDNVPIVLDISGFADEEGVDAGSGEARELVRSVAQELYRLEQELQKPFLIVVEECHEFIPQSGAIDALGQQLIQIGKRGRKRGLGLMGISQRPADVQKDFISQADLLVWHRVTWKNDVNEVGRVLGSDYRDAVGDLRDGEAYVRADWDETIERVQWNRKRTFDAGATPELGEMERPDLKSVSGDLLEDLDDIAQEEQERKDRVAQLESRLEAKDEEIAELEAELERAEDMRDMAQQFTDALTTAAGDEDAAVEKIQADVMEIREEKRDLESELEAVREERDALQEQVASLQARVDELEEYEAAVENLDDVKEAVSRLGEALGMDAVDGDAEAYRRRVSDLEDDLQDKQSTIAELEARLDDLDKHGFDEEFTEKMDFIKHDAVRDEIDRAIEKARPGEDAAFTVISILVDRDHASAGDIHPLTDLGSRSSVSDILSKLEDHGVVTVVETPGRDKHYALNREGMKDVVKQQRKREEIERLKSGVMGDG